MVTITSVLVFYKYVMQKTLRVKDLTYIEKVLKSHEL